MKLDDKYRGYSTDDILFKFITGQIKPNEFEYWYDVLTYALITEHSQDDIKKIIELVKSDDYECRKLGESLLFSYHLNIYNWLLENNVGLIIRVMLLLPYNYAKLYK